MWIKSVETNTFDDKYYMINIISNYIFGLMFQSSFVWKWTLESKSEYIVENNIYHFVVFQKCICFYW